MRAGEVVLLALALVAVLAYFLFSGSPALSPVSSGPGAGTTGGSPAPTLAPAPLAAAVPPPMRPPTDAPETGPADPDEPVVVGRVVDETRTPVAKAAVVRVRDGLRDRTTTSGPDGRFEVAGGLRAQASGGAHTVLSVRVVTHDGRTAIRRAWVGPSTPARVDLGTIVVRPGDALRARVTRGGVPVAGAAVVLQRSEAGPDYLTIASARSGEDGVAAFPPSAKGRYRVVAAAPGSGRGAVELALPRADAAAPLEVALPEERRLEIRLVDAATKAPVSGAEVEVHEQVITRGGGTIVPYEPAIRLAPSDGRGVVEVSGLGADSMLVLGVRAPGRPPLGLYGNETPHVPKGATSLVVELPRGRTVRWKAVDGDVPRPPGGTTLVLRPVRRWTWIPDTARIEGEDVVADGVGPWALHAEARAPDGAVAVLVAGASEERGGETRFTARRVIEVVATEPDGRPAEGVFVFARRSDAWDDVTWARTDAAGAATLPVSIGRTNRFEVLASLGSRAEVGRPVGTVDLAEGGARVAFAVQPVAEYAIEVRRDGAPFLPLEYTLSAGVANEQVDGIEEEPSTGRLRFRSRSFDPTLDLTLHADGFLPARASAAPGAITRIDLQGAGSVLLRLTPPSDRGYQIQLQRWVAEAGGWEWITRYRQEEVDGGHRGEGLEPGRYRLVEPNARVATPEFEVAGGRTTTLSWDLSRLAWVEGRVEAPEGTDLAQAVVRTDLPDVAARAGRTPPPPSQGIVRAGKDGRFALRVPGDRDVALTVAHPEHVPAAPGGVATVRGATSGVVLRLEAGSATRIRFDPDPRAPVRPSPYRVLLFRGDPGGAPALERTLLDEGDAFRFAGFEPGRWTLWIDLPRHAPLVLRGVELGSGATDLGTVRLADGASIVLRVARPDAPRLRAWVVARHLGEPAYERSVHTDADEVRLPGLGPGRFQVQAGAADRGPSIDRTVEVDGATDVPLTIDLR